MDVQKRIELQQNSQKIKKLDEINKNAKMVQSMIDEEVQKLETKCAFNSNKSEGSLESQMLVCVRTRPPLEHEQIAGYTPMVHSSNPRVLVTEPHPHSARKEGAGFRLNSTIFDVDMAFGPEDDNEIVYESIIHPILNTASKVGLELFE